MYLDIETYTTVLQQLKDNEETFTEVKTGSSQYIKIRGKRYYKKLDSTIEIPQRDLKLFKAVQIEASQFIKKEVDIPNYQPIDVDFNLSNYVRETFNKMEVVEIDLVGAYTREAERIGIISKATRQALEKASKGTRLMAFGSLATQRTFYYYKDGKLASSKAAAEKKTRHLFFYVAYRIGEIMKQVLKKFEGALFYWVDAVFVPKNLCNKVHAYLRELGIKNCAKGQYLCNGYVFNDGYRFELTNVDDIDDTKTFYFDKWSNYKTSLKVAEKERELFKKSNLENPALFREKIIQTYGTDKVSEIDLMKVCQFLDKYDLDYTVYLKYKTRIETEIKRRIFDTNREKLEIIREGFFIEYINTVYDDEQYQSYEKEVLHEHKDGAYIENREFEVQVKKVLSID
jgi:hypothetical protein